MAASNHFINKCDQIRQIKNEIIKHQIRRKIKATRLAKFLSCFFKWLECVAPPGMRRRSDVSISSHIGQDVADHAETSSWRRNWYVNEADLFETSLRRLIGT